jgi:hypothetical protein
MADETDLNINIGANPAGVEQGSRRAKAAVKGVTDESKQLDAAFRRLKASIDPTFAATERYNKALADNKRLLDAGRISKEMYARGAEAAYAALQQETAAIQRNSAAGRAAAAEQKALKLQQAADARAAAQAEVLAAREKAAAERQAAREAAAAVKQAKAEERQAIREAAAAAKLAAREKAAAERQAASEAAQAARDAANAAKQAAREKSQAERQASREAAEAEKQAKREARQAARDAAAVAAQAAKEKRDAERNAARASKEAAAETERLAKAERMAANAAQELRASIDPAYASQMRYNDTMRKATQLLMQNKLQTGEWTAIQRQAKAQMDLNVRSLGRQNAMYVQLGYQAQDVTASLASGINPLVILAQQGGQTAAAMATMGGTVGRVASFFAGPWGAAIIGFTLLLGYLWKSEDEGKKKTLDLNDAESRRIATVKELTAAIRDQIAAQREQNNQNLINLRNANNLNYTDQQRLLKAVSDAQKEVNDALAEYNRLRDQPIAASKGGMEAQAGQLAAASGQLAAAQRKLADAQSGLKTVTDALTESRVRLAQAQADTTKVDTEHQLRLQELTDTYRKSGQTLQDYQTYLADMRAENDRWTAAKEKEAQARRDNDKAARDEAKAIFQSREAAIGVAGRELRKEGFSVGENNQFGGVTGGHANNSDHAKYAIDVGIPGFGPNNPEASDAAARKKMDEIAKAYQARGFRVIWNGKTYEPGPGAPIVDFVPRPGAGGDAFHRSHMDIKAPESIVGKPAGKGLANDLIADAQRVADEQRRIEEEALKDSVAAMEFRKELANDDLAQVLKIQDEKIAAIRAFYGEDSKEALDAQREKIRIERQQQQEQLRIAQETVQRKLQIATQEADLQATLVDNQRKHEQDLVDFAVQNNMMGERRSLEEKKRILNEEYNDQLNHETVIYTLKYKSIQDQLALENLTLEARRKLLNDLELLQADHNIRMREMQASNTQAIQQINIQSANVANRVWRESAQTLSGSLSSAFQQLYMRSITWKQAMLNIADQFVFKFADMGLQMVANWATAQLRMLVVHKTTEVAKTASTVAGATARASAENAGFFTRVISFLLGLLGIHIGTEASKTTATVAGAATRTVANKAETASAIASAVGIAGANGVASWALAPWPIDAGAPAFGAAMAGSAAALGSVAIAERGLGEVAADGQMAMLHKKEAVLPAWIAEPMRQLFVSNRGSSAPVFAAASAAGSETRGYSNSSANFYYQPSHTMQNISMRDLLRQDGRELRRWLNNEHRNGTLLPGSKK